MKLLIDARNLGVKPSGMGMNAYNWIKALDGYDDFDIHVIVDVIESDQIKELYVDAKVTVHCYGSLSNKSASVFKYFRFVQQLIFEVRPDIFWETNNLAPIKIKNPYGKYIVTIADMFPLTMKGCFGRIYPYYFKYGIGKTIKTVDAILYISNCTKKETERFFSEAKKKKNFVSYVIIPPIPKMDVATKDYFLYMGNLEKRKGSDILLGAYEEYVMQGGTRELVVAGKIREDDIGEKVNRLEAAVPTFRYLGYVDNETRARLYRECSCFVFPSRAEGFGMPVIEAMSCGKSVIASDLDVFQELVGDRISTFKLKNDIEDVERLCQELTSYKSIGGNNMKVMESASRFEADNLASNLRDYLMRL